MWTSSTADRNPHGKNLENRSASLRRPVPPSPARRARPQSTRARSARSARTRVSRSPPTTLHEPASTLSSPAGSAHIVFSGNKEFSAGDRILRPPGGRGGTGDGGGQGNGGGGEDAFRFVLTRDEFIDLFFEDLELPDLVKSADRRRPRPWRRSAPAFRWMGRPRRSTWRAHAPVHGAAYRPQASEDGRDPRHGSGDRAT